MNNCLPECNEPVYTGIHVMAEDGTCYQSIEVTDKSCFGCVFDGAGCQRPNDMEFACEDVGQNQPDVIWVKSSWKKWREQWGN